MQIHLIRHTTPDISKGVCYGQSNIALANSFEEEKKQVLAQLHAQYDQVYSSPLSRCLQLAKEISTQECLTDERLLEMNFGDWELQSWKHIHQETLNTWMDDFVNVQVPNGESFQEVKKRVYDFIEYLSQQQAEKVAVVTHAGVIRLWWAWILDIPLKNVFRLQIGLGEVCEIQLQPQQDYCSIKTSFSPLPK